VNPSHLISLWVEGALVIGVI